MQNETVNVRVDNPAATDIGPAVLQFAAQTDITYAVNIEVKNSVFDTTAGARTLNDVGTTSESTVTFSDNTFQNYDSCKRF